MALIFNILKLQQTDMQVQINFKIVIYTLKYTFIHQYKNVNYFKPSEL